MLKLSAKLAEIINMKQITFFIILLSSFNILAGEVRAFKSVKDLQELTIEELELDYSESANLERSLKNEGSGIYRDIQNILKAKYKIISGDLNVAEFLLERIDENSSTLIAIKSRYLGLISFIRGDYKKAIDFLDHPTLNNTKGFRHTCVIKIVSLMALDANDKIAELGSRCVFANEANSKNEGFWLDLTSKMKIKNVKSVNAQLIKDSQRITGDDELTKVWLKTALYLNKEFDILKGISILSDSAFQSKKIRELVGFLYLRNNDFDRALNFIEDIDSANAENIKGVVNLKKKEYELAWGHFQLALNKKSDSQNSLERAIPLAFILKEYQAGLNMIKNVHNRVLDKRKKATVNIAFLIGIKDFEKAKNELTIVKNQFNGLPPYEIIIMDAYIDMMLSKMEVKYPLKNIEENLEQACKSFDGMSCWMYLTHINWTSLGKTVKRTEDISNIINLNIEEWKVPHASTPLKESISVDQKDIEELDGQEASKSLKY